MALETLRGVTAIGGYPVVVMDDLRTQHPEKFNASGAMDWTWFEKEIRPKSFVYVRHDKNSVSFTLQNGPVKTHGVNGCQVDTLIETAKIMLEGLDERFSCMENREAISKLESALEWLKARTRDREARGVEGKALN